MLNNIKNKSLSGSWKSSFSQRWKFNGRSSSGVNLVKDGSASGAESLAVFGRVRDHFSGFLPLEEPATLVQALPLCCCEQ